MIRQQLFLINSKLTHMYIEINVTRHCNNNLYIFESPPNAAIHGILRETTSQIRQYACVIGYLATVASSSDSEIGGKK